MIELTALTETGLNANTAVELRKAAAELGIKGASKGRKADLIAEIMKLVEAAKAEAAKQAEVKPVKKGTCEDCGKRRISKLVVGPNLCDVCYDYAGWENTHQDGDTGPEDHESCPICHPELDKRYVVREGRSRAGMEIVARGTEVHKAETFRVAAEAAGWTVKIMDTFAETEGDGPIRYYADAHRGNDAIQLAWEGRAYDYPSSSARIGGKDRKVRNLKEALRLLAA